MSYEPDSLSRHERCRAVRVMTAPPWPFRRVDGYTSKASRAISFGRPTNASIVTALGRPASLTTVDNRRA